VAEFLARHATLKTDDGRSRIVRHDHLSEREVMTGIGPVAVVSRVYATGRLLPAIPRASAFSPSILPPYMRRSRSIETRGSRRVTSPRRSLLCLASMRAAFRRARSAA
jgi:hypothetical protein